FVALIIVALLLQRRRRDRSDDAEATSWEAIDVVRPLAAWQRRLPAVRWGRLAVWAAVAAIALAVPAVLTPSRVFLASNVLVFAVTSLGFAVAVGSFFLNARFFPYLLPTHRPERPVLFGWLDLNGELAYFYFSLAVLALLALAVAVLRRTRTGRVLVAMRDNDRAARSFGIGRITSQLMAFALSGFVAGVAGGVLAAHDHAVSASAFAPAASIAVFSMAVIGGVGSLLGAVLGAVLVRGVTLSLTAQWAQLTTGLGLLVVLLVFPGGLGRAVGVARDALVRRLGHGAAPPPGVPADAAAPTEPPARPTAAPDRIP